MKKSVFILAMLVLNLDVVAEPAVVAPVKEQVVEVVKKEFTIKETTSKVIVILEGAFGAMVSVKDDESLKAAKVKLDQLGKEMLALEPQVDATVKPDDKQMKEAAVGFVRMSDRVSKQMEAMMAKKLSAELEEGRQALFMDFLKVSDPLKQKMDALMPPKKLNQFVKEIKAEEAEAAKKKEGASE